MATVGKGSGPSKRISRRALLRDAGAVTAAVAVAAVAFLCSADADYITGHTLNVDGGYPIA